MKLKLYNSKLLFAFLLFSANVYAQKPPLTQKESLFAPANIKIDGNLNEWPAQFKAYNPTSRVFYTIANDDNNLYLALRMDGEGANMKAINGGITFTISTVVKNKNTKNITITYPAVVNRQNNTHETLQASSKRYKMLKTDNAGDEKLAEFIKLSNQQIASIFKEIQITGIDEITDPTISIYNTDGIKAVVIFNEQMQYTYELAIPLKFISKAITVDKLRCNIKLNAKATIATGLPPAPTFLGQDLELLYQNNATDFWGEYTLAKK